MPFSGSLPAFRVARGGKRVMCLGETSKDRSEVWNF